MFHFLRHSVNGVRRICLKSNSHIDIIKKSSLQKYSTKVVMGDPDVIEKLTMSSDSFSHIPYVADKHKEVFKALRAHVIKELTHYDNFGEVSHMVERSTGFMEQSLVLWENARAMTIVAAYLELSKNRDPKLNTKEDLFNVYMIGWSFELFEVFSVLYDDVVDHAEMRIGKPTWFRQNNENIIATYDIFILQMAARIIADKYFKGQPYYYPVQKIITECAVKLTWGQIADVEIPKRYQNKMDQMYTLDFYETYVPYKSEIYFSEPVKLAMHVTGQYDDKVGAQIDHVCHLLGQLWQNLDDYLDFFQDSKVRRKTSNDIAEGKCSLMIIMALKHANEKQRKILKENYGQRDPEKVQAVAQIYRDLDLAAKFKVHEKEVVDKLDEGITNISNEGVRKVLKMVVHTMHDWHH